MHAIPSLRVRPVNEREVRPEREFVLYWMTSARRPAFNFSLDRAVAWARELDRPLLVLEALRCDYPYASDRLHRYVLDGMADNRAEFADAPLLYWPYVEPRPGAGKGLLAALGKQACVVVGDDFPTFFLPRMLEAAGDALDVRLEAVDGNGLVPLRAIKEPVGRAFDFRRLLQRTIATHLASFPRARPFAGIELPVLRTLPADVQARWPAASEALLAGGELGALPIDHSVEPVSERGGHARGRARLRAFLTDGLARYGEERNHPDSGASSRLSAYLHFGHLGVHEVFAALAKREEWTRDALGDPKAVKGKREGFWNMSASAEAFLDELVTWRELGYVNARLDEAHATYATVPAWAQRTLAEHGRDPRERRYDVQTLAAAATYDRVWNAAQRELLTEGRIHNYLRMLWGKKVLEWSRTPEEAARALVELNDRYAIDGRDPNSYTGIFWCFGKYDRPWGPERPVFGTVRYMSSEQALKKLDMARYMESYGADAQ